MPESVSTVGPFLLEGYAVLTSYLRADSAVSSEAQDAREVACTVVESAEQSQVLFGEKAGALSQLWAIATECRDADWDGSGATAINTMAVQNTEDFIRALPSDIPIPEFAPEPDGSISLDWIESRTRMFSLSVGATLRLAFAWLDGTDRGHGVARFDRESVPSRVLEGIRAIVNHDIATFRPL